MPYRSIHECFSIRAGAGIASLVLWLQQHLHQGRCWLYGWPAIEVQKSRTQLRFKNIQSFLFTSLLTQMVTLAIQRVSD
jgi:hypothetical protein